MDHTTPPVWMDGWIGKIMTRLMDRRMDVAFIVNEHGCDCESVYLCLERQVFLTLFLITSLLELTMNVN